MSFHVQRDKMTYVADIELSRYKLQTYILARRIFHLFLFVHSESSNNDDRKLTARAVSIFAFYYSTMEFAIFLAVLLYLISRRERRSIITGVYRKRNWGSTSVGE